MTPKQLTTTPWMYIGEGKCYRSLFQVVDCDKDMDDIVAWTHPAFGEPDEDGYTWRGNLGQFQRLFKATTLPKPKE